MTDVIIQHLITEQKGKKKLISLLRVSRPNFEAQGVAILLSPPLTIAT